jgi:hypothetical protein
MMRGFPWVDIVLLLLFAGLVLIGSFTTGNPFEAGYNYKVRFEEWERERGWKQISRLTRCRIRLLQAIAWAVPAIIPLGILLVLPRGGSATWSFHGVLYGLRFLLVPADILGLGILVCLVFSRPLFNLTAKLIDNITESVLAAENCITRAQSGQRLPTAREKQLMEYLGFQSLEAFNQFMNSPDSPQKPEAGIAES